MCEPYTTWSLQIWYNTSGPTTQLKKDWPIVYPKNIQQLIMPENLKLGMMIQKHRQAFLNGDVPFDYHAFVLGQSPFHTPYPMQEALAQSAKHSFYSPAKGIEYLIDEVIGFHQRHFDVTLTPERLVIGNGTKMIMFMLLSMLDGHYLVPAPAWIGYVPLLDYLGRRYDTLRLTQETNYKVTPQQLDDWMQKTEKTPIFILNNPHNPTGALYKKTELEALVEVCKKHQAFVISDEIYALVTYQQAQFVSMAKLYPERTFVTNGISKDRSAAGYRLGTCILPSVNTAQYKDTYVAFASTLYTNVSTPIQHAAITAYQANAQIEDYMATTRAIHTMVGQYFANKMQAISSIDVSMPEGGFYFVIDFNRLKPVLKRHGITDGPSLTEALLKAPYHVALVMGESIACARDDLLARIAFIDYDGEHIFKQYQASPPNTFEEKTQFIETHMAHMVKGFDHIITFINDHS